jgi:glucosylceramidase
LKKFLLLGISIMAFQARATDWVGRTLFSSLDGSSTLISSQSIFAAGSCPANQTPTVKISEQNPRHLYSGAGAALTEATALLLSEMNPTEKQNFLQQAFGPQGLRLNFLRVPIGSTDFSPVHVSCDDILSPQADDVNLQNFDFDRCAGNLTLALKQILQINPSIHLIASPWSAPAWMKSSDSLVGGSLKKEFQDVYARYLARFLKEMEVRGIHFEYLTVENEPLYNEVWARYPWMHMEALDQAELIGQHVGPVLVQMGLSRTKILAYDHNWDHTDYPQTVLKDATAARFIQGIAFHCYGGVPEEMIPLAQEFPEKEIHMTECAAGGWIPTTTKAMSEALDTLVIRNLKSASQSLVYWNLLLDENNGPKNGGCENCRGIFNLQSSTHQISGSPEAVALAHLTSVVDPNSQVVKSSELAGVSQIAFRNPNGDVAWIALNSTEADMTLQVETAGHCAEIKIPALGVISTRLSPLPPSRR